MKRISRPTRPEPGDALQEPAFPRKPREPACPVQSECEMPETGSKPLLKCRTVPAIGSAAICMCLASCFFPYEGLHDYGSGHPTTYKQGYRVDSLPNGYRIETISGSTYYYHDGVYYRSGSAGYVIVEPPRNSRYHGDYARRSGSFQPYREDRESPDRHDGRYDRGEIITRLPDGYRVVNHRGNTYYQVGNRYYRRQGEIYVIASKPY